MKNIYLTFAFFLYYMLLISSKGKNVLVLFFYNEIIIDSFITVIGSCYDVTTIEAFVREVQRRYLQAANDIGNPEVQPEQLSRYSIGLEAAALHLKKIQWFLTTEQACSDQLLTSVINNLSSLEQKVGVMVHRLTSVATFLIEQQSYQAPTQESGVIGRPAYLISKEQLEAMRYYGLRWTDIAKSLGIPKNIRYKYFVTYFVSIYVFCYVAPNEKQLC